MSAISLIMANTALSGNNTSKASFSSIVDFTFLKHFKINIHHPKAPVIKEIIWNPPLINWIKCNIDGASKGNPGIASCAGVFRNFTADFICGFAEPLGIATSYFAELCGAMRAVELAHQRNWLNLWIETDSTLVVLAFKNFANKLVTWSLRNRWNNTQFLLRQMNCIVTHTYREGNQVADILANQGLSLTYLCIWSDIHVFIREYCMRNKLGLSSFRFSS
jgi:ribonuclease HI